MESLPMLAALIPLSVLASPLPQIGEPPPGLVRVEGGPTTIGSRVEEVERLAKAQENLVATLAGETPRFRMEVDDFFLMPTEVTNEQYAAYLLATGSRPPRSFGAEALERARNAFLEDERARIADARAAGRAYERSSFDPDAWWQEHWREVRWEVPAEELAHPVVLVAHAEAEAYARWAGLRLMSEFEFQRAARGNGEQIYPWGNDWDDREYCRSLHSGGDGPLAVGSYPTGAAHGIFDLAGNVWEWTASSYTAYPGFEPLRFTSAKGKRVLEGVVAFDPEQRVVVGGSFQMDKVGVRLTTRRSVAPATTTNALGFRCAASVLPGVDSARALTAELRRLALPHGALPHGALPEGALPNGPLPEVARLVPESAAVLQRWQSVDGSASAPGYAVITRHDHVLFAPVASLPAAHAHDLDRRTREDGPLTLGMLALSVACAEPDLDAGTYVVAWRGAGPLAKPAAVGVRTPREAAYYEVPGFDPDRDCFLFYDAEGIPQAALAAPRVIAERARASRVSYEPYAESPTPAGDEPALAPLDTVRVTMPVESASAPAKAFVFDLALRFRRGVIDERWQ